MSTDVNNDGISDLIKLSHCNVNAQGNIGSGTYVYISYSHIDDDGTKTFKTSRPFWIGDVYLIKKQECTPFDTYPFIDIDGDGCNDMIFTFLGKPNSLFWIFYGSRSVGSVTLKNHGLEVPTKENSLFTVADFDGDGRAEIVYLDTKVENGVCRGGYIKHVANVSSYPDTFEFEMSETPNRLLSGDYNNDGLIDLIAFSKNGYTIYYNNGGANMGETFTNAVTSHSGDIVETFYLTQGDFNSDGLVDLIYAKKDTKKIYVALNNGDGTFDINESDELAQTLSDDFEKNNIIVCDIDLDGYSDVMVAWQNKKDIRIQQLFSNGVSLSLKKNFVVPNAGGLSNVKDIFTGDFDGDGHDEIVNYGGYLMIQYESDDTGFYYYYPYSKKVSDNHIVGISDGMGRDVVYSYATLSNAGVYSSVQSYYPIKTFNYPMTVVSSLFEQDGNRTNRLNYKYETLKYHCRGRGSLGFESVSNENTISGEQQIVKNTQWNRSHYVPTESMAYSIVDGDTCKTISRYQIHDVDGNYVSFPKSETTVDLDGETIETQYTYDNAKGVLLSKKAIVGGVDMYKEESYSDYQYTGNSWMARIIDSRWKHEHDDNVFSSRTKYRYDAKGNVLSVTEHDGSPMQLTTSMSYDNVGNITSKVSMGAGVISVKKMFEYDDDGRFLIKQYTEPSSAVIKYTYDNWGNVLSEIDETEPGNKLVRRMYYDESGRKISETAPDGTKTRFEYGWGRTEEYRSYVKTIECNGCETIVWYDYLGRKTLVKSRGIGDVEVATITSYDALGRVTREDNYSGELQFWKNYTYDKRNRVICVDDSRKKTEFRYGVRSQVKTVNGREYTAEFDQWGNVISSVDPVSQIEYRYNSNGMPSSIVTGDSSVNIKYDDAGNKIELKDPDAGTNTYAYAADGTMIGQTDGRGISSVKVFDELGRVVQVNTGERVVTTTYGDSGYSNQRVTRYSDGHNHIDYDYDKYGRPVTETRTIDGKGSFTFGYEYNSLGQVAKLVYPGDMVVEYEYDSNGNRTGMKVNGDIVWSFQSNDGRNYNSILLSDFVYTKSLDEYGYFDRLGLVRNSEDEEDLLQEIALAYDASTGNLMSRQYQSGLVKSYMYDDLDRLTNIYAREDNSMEESEVLVMEYSPNGNIIYKSDVGDYEYQSRKPHAVSEVTNVAGVIPSATQQVVYGDLGKVEKLSEGSFIMEFDYGPDGERWFSMLKNDEETVRETISLGVYERVIENGVVREYYFLDNGILVIKENDEFTPYMIFSDEQGSVLSVYDGQGTAKFTASYDEWGVQTVDVNEIGFRRGYTSHEMMPEFGVINMNGRLYDPVLARFFSPDNFVQQPTDSQNFNRYSYCLNNPLKYTDITGEWFGIDDLIVSAIGLFTGYISSGLATGKWGWSSIKSGLITAATSYLSYNAIGLKGSSNSLKTSTKLVRHSLNACVGIASSTVFKSITIPISNNVSYSAVPMVSIGEFGLDIGVSQSLSFNFGNGWNVSLSYGATNKYNAYSGSVSKGGYGLGYGRTNYYQDMSAGYYQGAQTTGNISLSLRNVSLRFSNDCIGDGADRWRSNAVAIGVCNYEVGTYLTNNAGKDDSVGVIDGKEVAMVNPIDNPDDNVDYHAAKENGADMSKYQWSNGKAYSAPLWIGYKSGNQVVRIGYSHPEIQNKTQNFVHRNVAPTPSFNDNHFTPGAYFYSGFNSPYSLW